MGPPAKQSCSAPGQDKTGAVRSNVHVIVLEAVDVLPHPSLAVNVLVCVRPHPLLCKAPSLEETVVTPQASVAVAVPSAALISPAVGLQPNVKLVPPVVIVGAAMSSVQVAVLAAVDVLPQTSCAVHVLVCDREQPVL